MKSYKELIFHCPNTIFSVLSKKREKEKKNIKNCILLGSMNISTRPWRADAMSPGQMNHVSNSFKKRRPHEAMTTAHQLVFMQVACGSVIKEWGDMINWKN